MELTHSLENGRAASAVIGRGHKVCAHVLKLAGRGNRRSAASECASLLPLSSRELARGPWKQSVTLWRGPFIGTVPGATPESLHRREVRVIRSEEMPQG